MTEGEVRAATIIQARFRGYQTRKLYFQKHLLLFEEVAMYNLVGGHALYHFTFIVFSCSSIL